MSIEIKRGEKITILPVRDSAFYEDPTYKMLKQSRVITGVILHVSCTTIVLEVTWWYHKDEDLKGKIINIRFSDIMGFEPE